MNKLEMQNSKFKIISTIFPLFLIVFTILSLFINQVSLAKAASASFSTVGGGSVTTNQSIRVTVNVVGSDPYNAVTVVVNFTNLVFLSSSAGAGWTPVAGPSASGGQVSFSGAVLGNSFTGSRNVLTLNFRAPAAAGTATVRASGNIALANGSGSQVSGGGNTATYTVKTPPPPTPTAKPAAGAVTVTSTTHPDQALWYKAKDATLTWNKASGVTGFSYQLSRDPNTNPDDTIDSTESNFTAKDLKEGANFFVIKAKNDVGWSGVTKYTLNIDFTAPDPFTPTYSKDDKKLYFSTNDNSGIAQYLLSIDSKDMGAQTTGFAVPADAKAAQVTAVDKAGNTKVAAISFAGAGEKKEGNVFTEYTSANASTDGDSIGATEQDTSVFQKYGVMLVSIVLGLGFLLFGVFYSLRRNQLKRSVVAPKVQSPSTPVAPA